MKQFLKKVQLVTVIYWVHSWKVFGEEGFKNIVSVQ